MNPNIKLIRPGGLAVWSFLRIFKYEYKIWERSWVQFPVRPFFSFFSLGESCWSYVHELAADSEVVYDCWGRCLPFLDISHDTHTCININQHSLNAVTQATPFDSWTYSITIICIPASPSPTWTSTIPLISLHLSTVHRFTLRFSIYVKVHYDMSESYSIFSFPDFIYDVDIYYIYL